MLSSVGNTVLDLVTFLKLTVESFNGIGRIDDSPDFNGIFGIGVQVSPVFLP
jgi:hypothetical protein